MSGSSSPVDRSTPPAGRPTGPLAGLRVLELGQLLAGPFAATLLAWFGADVIKVEPPGTGDPLRNWRALYKGTALWWLVMGRNKRSVTANLREPEGRDLVRGLAQHCDVLIENFRPGRLEAWDLGEEVLREINPRLVVVRVSGWGQTGPYAPRPGYASVAEGAGGLRYVSGFPDRPPVRANLSLGDTIAGLHAALGALAAVYHRDGPAGGRGQVVDVAIYETILNLMESTVPELDKLGLVRERQGAKLSGIAPSNTYQCRDGRYVIIGGNGDSIFRRLMTAAARDDLANDARLAHNDGRVAHEAEIDAALSAWTGSLTFDEVMAALDRAEVPAGPIYSVADQVRDPHFQARGVVERVPIGDDDSVLLPTLAPRFSETPGSTAWPGPPLGAHNDDVYGRLLGLDGERLADLRTRGII